MAEIKEETKKLFSRATESSGFHLGIGLGNVWAIYSFYSVGSVFNSVFGGFLVVSLIFKWVSY